MCFSCPRTLLPITAENDIPIIKLCYTDTNGGIFGHYYRDFRYNLQCKTPRVLLVKRVNELSDGACIDMGYHAFLKQGAVVSTNSFKDVYHFGDKQDSSRRTFGLTCNEISHAKVFEGYIPKGTAFYERFGEVVAESIVLTGAYKGVKKLSPPEEPTFVEEEPKESAVSKFFKFVKKIFNKDNYVLDWSR